MSELTSHILPGNSSPSGSGVGGMNSFAELLYQLSASTKTNDKLETLSHYFAHANEKDKVWVIALFSGRRPRRTVSGTQLAAWCTELIHLPGWLFGECYHTVGDLSETIALLIPEKNDSFPHSTGGSRGEAQGKPLHYY